MTDPPGLSLSALTAWLDRSFPGLRRGELTADVVAGGRSNLTYRVGDGSSTWALRRPPLGHVLPTAHDMAREYRVIAALAPTDVPVPSPVGLCEDVEVLGAPFYLMSFVDGIVLDSPARVAQLSADQARRAGEVLVDALVALHRVDPVAVGLADFGRPEGFLARQLERWHKQFLASVPEPSPVEDEVIELLRGSLPASGPAAIVHGDYRLTNVLLSPDAGVIRAIVDWEMAALGDPLCDVGLLAVYHSLAEHDSGVMPQMSRAAGFLGADELIARYAAASGRDLGDIDWYLGFGFYKLAVISQGIAARYELGLTVGPGFETFGRQVPILLRRALDAVRRRS